jgi:cobalt-zinc-cadmium efflux system membrane fusion protein
MRIAYLLLSISLLLACTRPPVTHASPQDSSQASSHDAKDARVVEVHNPSAASEIRMAPVRKKALAGTITATAMIEADPSMVARVAPRIQARVVRLIVELGQSVKSGDPLVVLSSIELGKAKTNYLKAKSLESIASQHLEREQKLYGDKIASKKDVLNARGDYDSALAELQASRELLRTLIPEADIDRIGWSNTKSQPLSEFSLISPIAGTVVKRDLTPGSIISDDADVLTIMNLDRIRVLVDVFEHDLAMLHPGEPAIVTVEAYPNQRFTGTVASIGDTVDRSTRTVRARIDVPNPDHRLKPGMFAKAEIATAGKGGAHLSVPASAIFEINGEKSVFVGLGENRFAVTRVEIGEVSSEDIQIVSGVHEGDRVVAQGGLLLKAIALNQVASH